MARWVGLVESSEDRWHYVFALLVRRGAAVEWTAGVTPDVEVARLEINCGYVRWFGRKSWRWDSEVC